MRAERGQTEVATMNLFIALVPHDNARSLAESKFPKNFTARTMLRVSFVTTVLLFHQPTIFFRSAHADRTHLASAAGKGMIGENTKTARGVTKVAGIRRS